MRKPFTWLGALVLAASVAPAPAQHVAAAQSSAGITSPCATDSAYQRLAFWVGDWEVFDSTGVRYATQRVHEVIDGCAITAEWIGPVGDKGFNLSALDRRTGEGRQVYVSNSVPRPSGITMRRSDPSYRGPGIRFVPLLDPPAGDLARSRITIIPLSGHRALQLFESSQDGGETWRTVFKAEHRASGDGPT
jgi:hypothetical protein